MIAIIVHVHIIPFMSLLQQVVIEMAPVSATADLFKEEFCFVFFPRSNVMSDRIISDRAASLIGCVFGVCASLWNRLRPSTTIHPNAEFVHLFYALNFLKLYESYHVHASRFHCDPGTFEKWAWLFVHAIYDLRWSVIDFDSRFWNWNNISQCLMGVDGKDCKVREPSPFDPGMKSIKFKHAALKYEIGFGIFSGLIAWISGPHRGAKADITIFREGLREELEDWEMVEGDLGYEGDSKTRDKEVYESRQDGHEKSIVRARLETVNGRINEFDVVSKMFHHDLELHGYCFFAVGVIVQLGLMENPIWEVEYNVVYNQDASW
jgi:hypothetical protein